MAHEFRCKRRVEFSETDMARIVHFTHFFRYMEMAEHAFLRSLGLSGHTEIDGQTVSWPRLHAECSLAMPPSIDEMIEQAPDELFKQNS